ncbi:hypothetical protein SCALM49S_01992 [Streptomyces californicus]
MRKAARSPSVTYFKDASAATDGHDAGGDRGRAPYAEGLGDVGNGHDALRRDEAASARTRSPAAPKRRKEEEERAALDKLRVVVDEDITAYGETLERLDFHPAEKGADDAMRADYERALDSYETAKARMDRATPPRTCAPSPSPWRTAATPSPSWRPAAPARRSRPAARRASSTPATAPRSPTSAGPRPAARPARTRSAARTRPAWPAARTR